MNTTVSNTKNLVIAYQGSISFEVIHSPDFIVPNCITVNLVPLCCGVDAQNIFAHLNGVF